MHLSISLSLSLPMFILSYNFYFSLSKFGQGSRLLAVIFHELSVIPEHSQARPNLPCILGSGPISDDFHLRWICRDPHRADYMTEVNHLTPKEMTLFRLK